MFKITKVKTVNLKRYFKFWETPETRAIVNVANQLGIGEYRLFELAYADWSGHDPDPAVVDHSFGLYMFEGVAPPYVIRFARRVEEGLQTGAVSRETLGIPPLYSPGPEQRRIGFLALALLGVIMAFMVILVYLEAASGYRPVCFLPPCL